MTSTDSILVTEVSHRAMACDFVVLLPEWQKQHLDAVVDALESLDAIEGRLTVYRESSEVSRINARAADAPQTVSTATFDLIRRSVDLSQKTDGAFDVTAGPLVRLWGFLQRAGQKPTADEVRQTLTRVGSDKLILNEKDKSVAFAESAMELNLGAIGKGFAIDCLATKLMDQGLTDFLIHGGQSSVRACGRGQPQRDGWSVGIAHPTKPSRRVGGLWLCNQALATSGSGKQFFHHRGKRFGHVLDPRTGQPAGDLLALTLVADSATEADALATGLFVMGEAEAIRKNRSWVQDADPDAQSNSSASVRYPMLTIRAASRQDEITIDRFGESEFESLDVK